MNPGLALRTFLSASCCALGLAAAEPGILAPLKPGHPRLLADSADFAALKQRCAADPTLGAWLSQLRRNAERLLNQPTATYEIPDGLRLLAVSRRVLDRIYLLGLLDRLDGHPRWSERAWREMQAAAAFPDWNPRHFLDTAEMTHALAIGYDWMHERWSEDQRRTLRDAMIDKGLRIALAGYEGKNSFCWWTKARHNWNQVCNGGIGIGALAIADTHPELASDFLQRAIESIRLPMREFEPDGAWEEGPGYWDYATSYNTVFLAALRSALGTDFHLSDWPGYDRTGLFPLCLLGPSQRMFNYADGGDSMIRAPQLFWMARRYQRPEYARYQQAHASPEPLDLLWFEPRAAVEPAVQLDLDHHFRRAEIVTLRSRWDDTNALFVALKGGDNRANHSHLDLGSFVLDALGQRWGMDLGAEDYNLPGYFGTNRWTYYRLRAEGHNTLVLNPGLQPDQPPNAKAAIREFHSSPTTATATVDLTEACSPHARSALRTFSLPDRQSLLLEDRIDAHHPADAWWFFHTRAEVQLGPQAGTARLSQNGRTLTVRIEAPESASFQLMAAEPLPGSPRPNRQNPNQGVRKLAVHLPQTTECTLRIRFLPGS